MPLYNFNFGTKANNLDFLRKHLETGKICSSYIFNANAWENKKDLIYSEIVNKYPNKLIIVRSSADSEDSQESSFAGKYLSFLEVSSNNKDEVIKAINQVINSYGENISNKDQVLIQPFISNISVSGVVFSHDLTTGSPYYVINYDDKSGRTDTITSGSDDESRTLTIYRKEVNKISSSRFFSLLKTVKEIEEITNSNGVDIEFAITKEEEVYIFQVRPIAVSKNWNRSISKEVDNAISQIKIFLDTSFKPKKRIFGDTTLYGEMPDWNPAEMIGSAPRQLARSLYETLITDSIWAKARKEMGYLDMTNHSLMINLAGRVYIDVRTSFNSFLPAKIKKDCGEKIINFWLKKLSNNPRLHDKVEFDVAITAYTFDTDNRLLEFEEILNSKEIKIFKDLIFEQTNSLIESYGINSEKYENKLEKLDKIREEIKELSSIELNHLKELLNSCQDYGTKTFSCMARYGFIAESFLKSISKKGIWKPARVEEFRKSIETVLTTFLNELEFSRTNPETKRKFINKYGHLRPGTYDILAPRYDENFNRIELINKSQSKSANKKIVFIPTEEEIDNLNKELSNLGFSFGGVQLIKFIKAAISGREYGKLIFTKTVSDLIEFIARWGEDIGLSRNELSYISLNEILSTINTPCIEEKEIFFRNISKRGEESYKLTQAIKTPFLIRRITDIYVIPSLKSKPNFVTSKRVQAPIIYHNDHTINNNLYEGKIVLIERADPGYDWIFLSPIAGLVTQYGGANSHMAIRCAELDIPAAIGCGQQIFDQIKSNTHALLDCASGLLKAIN